MYFYQIRRLRVNRVCLTLFIVFRQGLEKMLEVYSQNNALGDPESIKSQLEDNAKRLDQSNEELHKYQVSESQQNKI